MIVSVVRRWSLLVFLPGLLFLTAGCGSTEEDVYVERPVEELYRDAASALEEGRYQDATKLFDEVERQHPYSVWAARAQLMAAYALYRNLDYDEAILTLDRFIQLHPGHERIAYAYYLRALCLYEEISDARRDQSTTRESQEAFREVVRRFPDSDYARDAKVKLDLTEDHLAGKEMNVGRFYLRQNMLNAAISRFRHVVRDYQTTSHVPEALHRLTEAYLKLGIVEEARKTAAVLGYNFPGSPWYADSYALLEARNIDLDSDESDGVGGMLARTFDSLF